MTPKRLLCLALLVGAAAALLAWNKLRPAPVAYAPPASENSFQQKLESGKPRKTIGRNDSSSQTSKPIRGLFRADEFLTLNENADIQSEENLLRLRKQSLRRLTQLEKSLLLSPDQQRQIYPLIARSSALFDQNIFINGKQHPPLTHAANQQKVLEILDPDQQAEFVDDLLEEREWWDDLVVELEAEIDAELTPSSPTTNEGEPTRKEENQTPFNLFKNPSN